jgi:hypothetical protein
MIVINAAKQRQAMWAIHMAICHVRAMALSGEGCERIADALDWLELLPACVYSDRDQTAEFENALQAFIEKCPDASGILHAFGLSASVS